MVRSEISGEAGGVAGPLRSQWRRRGARGMLLSTVRAALHLIVRRRDRLIWEMDLSQPPAVAPWTSGERLLILGPDNLDRELTPELRSFLGGDQAASDLDGVRRGDRLFVVRTEKEYLSCSYVFFDTTHVTRRQARIYGEKRGTPIIGMSFTAPAARGRGLYRRLLTHMFAFLTAQGSTRAICEVRPDNTPSNRASQAAGMALCRELTDWALLNRLFVQRVRENRTTRWRVLWV
jgi:RimJ/RimL family protein N-acetyltransferase